MSGIFQNIIDELLKKSGAKLTSDQEMATQEFLEFHQQKVSRSAYIMRGAAGTGKTFMIQLFYQFLQSQGFKVALLAPTGRAAKVLNRRVKRYASTIHRYIYTLSESAGGNPAFVLKENRDPRKMYYIVDEASMVGDRGEGRRRGLLTELLSFAYNGYETRKVIFVGDPYQLPPVGASDSPALDEEYLKDKFSMDVWSASIHEVMRQQEDSGILKVATAIRTALSKDEMPELDFPHGSDIQLMDNAYEGIELYCSWFDPDNLEQSVLLTYSNSQAAKINAAIRAQIFETTEALVRSDLVMVVKNNYAWGDEKFPFIANGEMGIIREVYRESKEHKYGLHWMDVEVEFTNLAEEAVLIKCKVILDLLSSNHPQINYQVMKEIMMQRRHEMDDLSQTKKRALLRKDPYLHALQIKYGYAVTGHKAQGGQWKYVIVAFEPLYKGMEMKDYLRWSYTALTRAEEQLYLFRCPFFKDSY